MIGMINPTWKREAIKSTSAPLQSSQDAFLSRLEKFKLHRRFGLLLDDDRA